MISIESATIPDAGVPDLLRNAEVALDPSVSAVIVTLVVVDGVLVDEEHPLINNMTKHNGKANVTMPVDIFIND